VFLPGAYAASNISLQVISARKPLSGSVFEIKKKFWEDLIAYFPWYDTGHIENNASNNSSIVACVFVTAVTSLPSRCLAKLGGFFTEPLPNNERRDTQTATRSHKPTLQFWKNKVGLWDHVAVRVSRLSLLSNGSVKSPLIVARQRLCYLCCQCRIKGK
jgi:hypothetical protein